jgi:hypothetical protein
MTMKATALPIYEPRLASANPQCMAPDVESVHHGYALTPLGAHTTMRPHLFAASGAFRLRRPKSRRGIRGEGLSNQTAAARSADQPVRAIEWAKCLPWMFEAD